LVARIGKNKESFAAFVGLQAPKDQLGGRFLVIWVLTTLLSALLVLLEINFSPDLKQLLTSPASPYFKILSEGFTTNAFFNGLLYCFATSAGAEEILFRGLIARRLMRTSGPTVGNFIQATVFWLVHFALFKLVTGFWFSRLQAITLFTSFPMGLLLGYVNNRSGARSIVPSWLIHGSANFATFLSLAFVVH
jgi:membrane protease YdiL (CAAX protease family)